MKLISHARLISQKDIIVFFTNNINIIYGFFDIVICYRLIIICFLFVFFGLWDFALPDVWSFFNCQYSFTLTYLSALLSSKSWRIIILSFIYFLEIHKFFNWLCFCRLITGNFFQLKYFLLDETRNLLLFLTTNSE